MIRYQKGKHALLDSFIVDTMNFNYWVVSKIFSIKDKKTFFNISPLCYILFYCEHLLISYIYIVFILDKRDYFFVISSAMFLFVLLFVDEFPYWIDGENQDDFKKNALTQLDILQNAYNKHNMSLVLEHLQYLQTVVEEERFEELHKIENLESVWKMKSKLEMIFKEIEKENEKLQWQTYRKEIKKPLNLLKDYLYLLRVSEE